MAGSYCWTGVFFCPSRSTGFHSPGPTLLFLLANHITPSHQHGPGALKEVPVQSTR